MQINQQLLDSFESMLQDFDDLEALNDFVDQLDEPYVEELSGQIDARRDELGGGLTLSEATPAEMADYFEARPDELQMITDAVEEEEDDEKEGEDDEKEEEDDAKETEDSAKEAEDGAEEGEDGKQEDSVKAKWSFVDEPVVLPLVDSSTYDAAAETYQILGWATGDDGTVDADEARRGFVLQDENADPSDPDAWLGTIGTVEDGELKVAAEALRTLSDRLDAADIEMTDELQNHVDELIADYDFDPTATEETSDSNDEELQAFAEVELADSGSFDSDRARADVLAQADGAEQASKFFLAGDSEDPTSLRVPIAKVEDGKIVVSAEALESAEPRVKDLDDLDAEDEARALSQLRAIRAAVGDDMDTTDKQTRKSLWQAAQALGLEVAEDADVETLAAAVRDASTNQPTAVDFEDEEDEDPSGLEVLDRLSRL